MVPAPITMRLLDRGAPGSIFQGVSVERLKNGIGWTLYYLILPPIIVRGRFIDWRNRAR